MQLTPLALDASSSVHPADMNIGLRSEIGEPTFQGKNKCYCDFQI